MAAAPQGLSEAQACEHLARFQFTDPMGRASVADVVRGAWCFALDFPDARMVYALRVLPGGVLLIAAAGARTRRATLPALQSIEAQARECRAAALAFQTARPGLVRLARRAGFTSRPLAGALVPGWWLEKRLDPHL